LTYQPARVEYRGLPFNEFEGGPFEAVSGCLPGTAPFSCVSRRNDAPRSRLPRPRRLARPRIPIRERTSNAGVGGRHDLLQSFSILTSLSLAVYSAGKRCHRGTRLNLGFDFWEVATMKRIAIVLAVGLALGFTYWQIATGDERPSVSPYLPPPANSVGRFQITATGSGSQGGEYICVIDTVTGHCWAKSRHQRWEDMGTPPINPAQQQ